MLHSYLHLSYLSLYNQVVLHLSGSAHAPWQKYEFFISVSLQTESISSIYIGETITSLPFSFWFVLNFILHGLIMSYLSHLHYSLSYSLLSTQHCDQIRIPGSNVTRSFQTYRIFYLRYVYKGASTEAPLVFLKSIKNQLIFKTCSCGVIGRRGRLRAFQWKHCPSSNLGKSTK